MDPHVRRLRPAVMWTGHQLLGNLRLRRRKNWQLYLVSFAYEVFLEWWCDRSTGCDPVIGR